MEKLKQTDLKLLCYLYQHNRESLTKIAKAISLSREQVEYRMKRYEKERIIKSYLPIVNYSKLGYNNLAMIFIKCSQPSQISQIKSLYQQDKNRIITAEILGKYNIGMVFIFKDNKEKNERIMEILEHNKDKISDHLIVEPYHMKFYPLKFLGSKLDSEYIWVDYHKGEIQIDEKEKKILKLLSQNARMRIIDIAKKTNLSAELVLYKLRRLQSEGLLLGSRTEFDMQKLGFFYTILQINMKSLSQHLAEKLEHFAKNSPYVETFYLSISRPNCYIQLFYKSEEELRQTIQDLNDTFKNESFDLDILPLKNEGEDINTLPFL